MDSRTGQRLADHIQSVHEDESERSKQQDRDKGPGTSSDIAAGLEHATSRLNIAPADGGSDEAAADLQRQTEVNIRQGRGWRRQEGQQRNVGQLAQARNGLPPDDESIEDGPLTDRAVKPTQQRHDEKPRPGGARPMSFPWLSPLADRLKAVLASQASERQQAGGHLRGKGTAQAGHPPITRSGKSRFKMLFDGELTTDANTTNPSEWPKNSFLRLPVELRDQVIYFAVPTHTVFFVSCRPDAKGRLITTYSAERDVQSGFDPHGLALAEINRVQLRKPVHQVYLGHRGENTFAIQIPEVGVRWLQQLGAGNRALVDSIVLYLSDGNYGLAAAKFLRLLGDKPAIWNVEINFGGTVHPLGHKETPGWIEPLEDVRPLDTLGRPRKLEVHIGPVHPEKRPQLSFDGWLEGLGSSSASPSQWDMLSRHSSRNSMMLPLAYSVPAKVKENGGLGAE